VDQLARTLSDILRRFRPAVAPGPAGPVGVPADRVALAEAELAEVFAAIESAVREGRRVREQANADSDCRRRRAAEQAERIAADARARADAVRADAAARGLEMLDDEKSRIEREARAEAARVQARADERMSEVVARVLDEVRATAGLRRAPVPTAGPREQSG
jgi:hypothetical protein